MLVHRLCVHVVRNDDDDQLTEIRRVRELGRSFLEGMAESLQLTVGGHRQKVYSKIVQ
jgi:hypothetical protein